MNTNILYSLYSFTPRNLSVVGMMKLGVLFPDLPISYIIRALFPPHFSPMQKFRQSNTPLRPQNLVIATTFLGILTLKPLSCKSTTSSINITAQQILLPFLQLTISYVTTKACISFYPHRLLKLDSYGDILTSSLCVIFSQKFQNQQKCYLVSYL